MTSIPATSIGCGSSSARMKAARIARANGVKMGRKPKLNPHQMKEARHRLAKGEKTRDLARIYAVSRSTISRLAF